VHDILFITPGPVEQWASSRLRCTWVAKYIENSYVIDGTANSQYRYTEVKGICLGKDW